MPIQHNVDVVGFHDQGGRAIEILDSDEEGDEIPLRSEVKPEARSSSPGILMSQADTAGDETLESPPAKRMRFSSPSSIDRDASGDVAGVVTSQDTEETLNEIQGTAAGEMAEDSLMLLRQNSSGAAQAGGNEAMRGDASTAMRSVAERASPSDTIQVLKTPVEPTESTQND